MWLKEMSTVKTLHKLREAIWPLENSIVLALAAHTVKMEQKVLHSERRTKKYKVYSLAISVTCTLTCFSEWLCWRWNSEGRFRPGLRGHYSHSMVRQRVRSLLPPAPPLGPCLWHKPACYPDKALLPEDTSPEEMALQMQAAHFLALNHSVQYS